MGSIASAHSNNRPTELFTMISFKPVRDERMRGVTSRSYHPRQTHRKVKFPELIKAIPTTYERLLQLRTFVTTTPRALRRFRGHLTSQMVCGLPLPKFVDFYAQRFCGQIYGTGE